MPTRRVPLARRTAGACRPWTARSCAWRPRNRICTLASARCSLRPQDVLARPWRRCASGRQDGCTRCRGAAGGSTRRRWDCPSRAGSMTSGSICAPTSWRSRLPDDRVSHASFEALRSAVLSAPLDRSRPLWQIFLVPRLEDGRVGMVGKIHHALVDGLAALQIVSLILDPEPDVASQPPVPWQPQGRADASAGRWTRSRGRWPTASARCAPGRPRPRTRRRPSRDAVRGAGRVLGAAAEEVLSPAPPSALNGPIGARRTLVGYHAGRDELRAAQARRRHAQRRRPRRRRRRGTSAAAARRRGPPPSR